MKAVAVFCLMAFLIAPPVKAEMSRISVAASVVAFDAETVTIMVSRKQLKVPRHFIGARDIKAGDAVVVTFRGNEIEYLLGANGAPSKDRGPASEKRPKHAR